MCSIYEFICFLLRFKLFNIKHTVMIVQQFCLQVEIMANLGNLIS